MRIAQVSDLHMIAPSWNLFPKRFLAYLNWLVFRRKGHNRIALDALPKALQELGIDLLLLGGDLSTTALPKEFAQASDYISRFKMPWLAVPGNHDCYTKRSERTKRFYRYFSNKRKRVARPVEFFTLEGHGVETHAIAPKWHLVLLDTAVATNPYSSQGIFSSRIEKNLREVLSLLPQDESIVLCNHYPFFHNDEPRHSLVRGEALEQLIREEARIKLYLHGHTHRQTLADLRTNGLPFISDSGSCCLGSHNSFNVIDLEEGAFKVTPYAWKENKWSAR